MVRAGSMRRALLRSFGLVLLMMMLCVSPVYVRFAYAEIEDTDTSKAIAVAYDNSGSMTENSKKWCIARYSLEVLAGMMGVDDTLTVVAMPTVDGHNPRIDVSGFQNASERVRAIHEADLGYSAETDPLTTQTALDTLKGSGADEKYLVITTDGQFTVNGGNAVVEEIVNSCADMGVKVMYLGIGSDAHLIQEKAGVTVKNPSEGRVVLDMKEFANLIYGRAALDGEFFDRDAKKLTLDVPMGTLIVLAQGENATVGTLKGQNGLTVTPDTAGIRYVEHPFDALPDGEYSDGTGKYLNAKYRDTAQVDTDLVGQVGVFRKEIPAGSYTLDVSGDEIEVYFKPYVDIETVVKDSKGAETNLSNAVALGYLPEDTYSVICNLKDPFTHETISSKLIGDPNVSLTVQTADKTAVYGQGDAVSLGAGMTSLSAEADLLGNVRVTNEYGNVKVVADLVPLSFDTSELNKGLNVLRFDADETCSKIRIQKQNGAPITQEEWDKAQINAKSDNGLAWNVRKTDEIGVVEICPTNGNRTADQTATELLGFLQVFRVPSRLFDITLMASIDDDFHPCGGTEEREVTVTSPFTDWGLRAILALLIISFVIWLIWFVTTWPQLPKAKLHPQLAFREDGEDRVIPFVIHEFKKGKPYKKCLRKVEGRLLPRRTQIMRFGPRLRKADIKIYVDCTEMELEAVSKHSFRFSKATERKMTQLSGSTSPHYLPKPEWEGWMEGYPVRNLDECVALEGKGNNWDNFFLIGGGLVGPGMPTTTYSILFKKPKEYL